MAGDLSEKATEPSSRTSSHGESSDDHDLAAKVITEGTTVQVPLEDRAAITKLDSTLIKVKSEEDIYGHLPSAEAEILKKQVRTTSPCHFSIFDLC